MDMLHVIDGDKSHYVYIKYFNRFMFHKKKSKKYFCKSCLWCFSGENVWTKHKKDCLSINGVQSVKLKKGTIKFNNYIKQIPVPFKIYADFVCNLKAIKIYEGFYSKTYQNHVPCSFAYKVICIDDRFSKPIVIFRGKNAAYQFIKTILEEYECWKKVMKKHVNKDLIMSEEEKQFQLSNTCWIC